MHFSLLPFDPYHKDAKRSKKSKICKVVRAEEEGGGGGGGGERERRKGLENREEMGSGREVLEGDASGWRAKEKETKERERKEKDRKKEEGSTRRGKGREASREGGIHVDCLCVVLCVCVSV